MLEYSVYVLNLLPPHIAAAIALNVMKTYC